jgi:hypothetical protein
MFQSIGTHTVTRSKVCAGSKDVEPPFPGLGHIGNLLGCVSLMTLFLLMAFLYVNVELIVQPYYASNFHPSFFWLGIKNSFARRLVCWGIGSIAPFTLHFGSGYRCLVSFRPRLLDPQGKSSFYPSRGQGVS